MNEKDAAVKKFVDASVWDFKRALEVALSEMGIEISVPGAYNLGTIFMILVKDEQEKAKNYLKKKEA